MIIYAIHSLSAANNCRWNEGNRDWRSGVCVLLHITHLRFCSGNPCCDTIASSHGCIWVHCLRLSLRKGKWVGSAPILRLFSFSSHPFLRSFRLKSYGPKSWTQSACPVALGPKVEGWKPVGKLSRAIFTCDSGFGMWGQIWDSSSVINPWLISQTNPSIPISSEVLSKFKELDSICLSCFWHRRCKVGELSRTMCLWCSSGFEFT